jgi:ketosteroid isomerase-like protein
MDSPALDSRQLEAELTEGGAGTPGPPRESANLRAIKEAFRAFSEGGATAGAEALLRISHPDCRFRPASAGGRVLQGHDEIRAYFSEPREDQGTVSVHPRRFAEHTDEVVVTGSMRVLRPEGGFAESQVSWTYRFRDGLVEEAAWGPPQAR